MALVPFSVLLLAASDEAGQPQSGEWHITTEVIGVAFSENVDAARAEQLRPRLMAGPPDAHGCVADPMAEVEKMFVFSMANCTPLNRTMADGQVALSRKCNGAPMEMTLAGSGPYTPDSIDLDTTMETKAIGGQFAGESTTLSMRIAARRLGSCDAR